jgi:hypothetical protein
MTVFSIVSEEEMVARTCHAIGCTKPCRPNELMDTAHWQMVPLPLRQAVWAAYQAGQERTKRVTWAYLQATAKAVIAVAEQEGRDIPEIWWQMATEKQEKRA